MRAPRSLGAAPAARSTGRGGAYNSPVGTVRELLNGLRWDGRNAPSDVFVVVRARRGGVESVEEVGLGEIVDILPGGVTVAGGVFLPFHRFVTVRRGEVVLWSNARK